MCSRRSWSYQELFKYATAFSKLEMWKANTSQSDCHILLWHSFKESCDHTIKWIPDIIDQNDPMEIKAFYDFLDRHFSRIYDLSAKAVPKDSSMLE